jgi:hypothetical protein
VTYPEPYMRLRDPESLIITDEKATVQMQFKGRFCIDFEAVRRQTFDWLKAQELCVFPFLASDAQKPVEALAICPANAGFFALRLAQQYGLLNPENVPEHFAPTAIVYVAPPFRHTHFAGKQVVAHNRQEPQFEVLAYSLFPFLGQLKEGGGEPTLQLSSTS